LKWNAKLFIPANDVCKTSNWKIRTREHFQNSGKGAESWDLKKSASGRRKEIQGLILQVRF